MDIYGKNNRIELVTAVLATAGYDTELATFIDTSAPYWTPIKHLNLGRLYLHFDDMFKAALAGSLDESEVQIDKYFSKCVGFRFFIETRMSDIYEVAEWLLWNYSDITKKSEFISTFTTGIAQVHFYDENDNTLFSEAFAMKKSKIMPEFDGLT